jgi:hypothetical protein
MKYLKGFKDLFESEEEMEEIHALREDEIRDVQDYPKPLNLFTREDVKNLDSYKSLIRAGFVDITPPRSEAGTFRFSHPMLDGMDIFIHANGYIRYQNMNYKPMYGRAKVAQAIFPAGYYRAKKVDMIYGQPVNEPHDYDIKFDWLKKYTKKKYLKSQGISSKGMGKENPTLLKRQISDMILRSGNAATAANLRKMFPELWDEIQKGDSGDIASTLADLGDIGF